MGWSGAEVFDRIIDAIMESVDNGSDEARDAIYREIVDTFRDAGWDTLCESEYYEHHIIGPLLKIDEEDEEY